MDFRKAHGTGNDFVLLPDLAGRLELSEELVRRLCDRRFGIGGDGVLRVVATPLAGEEIPDSGGCEYFMDYRNADGSTAQMCGNGARVFAQYLWDSGAAPLGPVRFATRGGARTAVPVHGGDVRVEMGRAVLGLAGAVTATAAGRSWPAMPVHVPNPHAVVFVDDLADAGPLVEAPDLHPAGAYPQGANVEFVVVHGAAHIAMRVHERGSGETLSCGTGACAAAVAHAARQGSAHDAEIRVDVPGGALRVTVRSDGTVTLTGPVATVAEGRVDPGWLEAGG